MRRQSAPSWWAPLTASRAFAIPQGKSGRVLSNLPLQQSLCPRAWRNAPERTSMTKIKFIDLSLKFYNEKLNHNDYRENLARMKI